VGYRCSCCGEWHEELPFAFHVPKPAAWLPEHEADVWTSLSRDNFARTLDIWDREGREAEPPMFGWLTVVLPTYEPSTLNLKTMVHTQPLGLRPLVELEPTEHPLAVEQREGITLARVQAIAERLLHEPG
jgi:hypothetical protein